MRYEVFSGDALIGWSDLEAGDPPMGVASGILRPTPAYPGALAAGNQLRVRPEGGEFFEPAFGVHVENYSADLGPEGIEVSVVGIEAATYERWFSDHLRRYEEQFRSDAAQPGGAADRAPPRR